MGRSVRGPGRGRVREGGAPVQARRSRQRTTPSVRGAPRGTPHPVVGPGERDAAGGQGPAWTGAAHWNRLIEHKVAELGGIKSLYSDSFFTPEEFQRHYGGAAYRALKAKYDPQRAFPELYEKCVLRR